MSQEFAQYNQHFVCTEAEARELIEQAKHVMVAHCGCRKSDGCSRSQSEVCLWFVDSGGFESRPITKDEVLVILAYGKEMGLVFRPFRSSTNKNSTEGICLCCDCCCSYFVHGNETSDKGQYVEATDCSPCSHCGLCVPVCYFKARKLVDDTLVIDQDLCYGCGLCVSACPSNCITMSLGDAL